MNFTFFLMVFNLLNLLLFLNLFLKVLYLLEQDIDFRFFCLLYFDEWHSESLSLLLPLLNLPLLRPKPLLKHADSRLKQLLMLEMMKLKMVTNFLDSITKQLLYFLLQLAPQRQLLLHHNFPLQLLYSEFPLKLLKIATTQIPTILFLLIKFNCQLDHS